MEWAKEEIKGTSKITKTKSFLWPKIEKLGLQRGDVLSEETWAILGGR